MEWLLENKEWLFSGLGLVVVGFLIKFLKRIKKPEKKIEQNINSGDQSINIQIGDNKTKK